MLRVAMIVLATFVLAGCQANKVGVTTSDVPGLDRQGMVKVVNNNMVLFPGNISEKNYTADACTPNTNQGCFRTGLMINENIVAIPQHRYMNGPYQDIQMNKNAELIAEVVNFRRDMEYFALGGVESRSNSAVKLDIARPSAVKDSRVVIAFYDESIKKVGTRVGVVIEKVKGRQNTPLLKIQADWRKGDVGAAVFTADAKLVGMIVNASEQTEVEGYRYAVPAPHMLRKLEEVAFF